MLTKSSSDVVLSRRSVHVMQKEQSIITKEDFHQSMLCGFDDELQKYGTHRYKELYWECGRIGQQLYLEATSLGLSGTRHRLLFR